MWPNSAFNADAKIGYAFGVFTADFGSRRPGKLRRLSSPWKLICPSSADSLE